MSAPSADARSYDRYCALSRALDVVGERWTLLIVLELLSGPKRFTDLEEGVAGIAKNLLSKRLKHLQAHGIVEKTKLDPPARATVYRLTPKGRDLEKVVRDLQRWGMDFLGEPDDDQALQPQWILQALIALTDEDQAQGLSVTYEFHLDDSVFSLRLEDGAIEGRESPAEDADLVIEGSARDFVRMMLVDDPPDQIEQTLDLTFQGDRDRLATLRALHDFAPGG